MESGILGTTIAWSSVDGLLPTLVLMIFALHITLIFLRSLLSFRIIFFVVHGNMNPTLCHNIHSSFSFLSFFFSFFSFFFSFSHSFRCRLVPVLTCSFNLFVYRLHFFLQMALTKAKAMAYILSLWPVRFFAINF